MPTAKKFVNIVCKDPRKEIDVLQQHNVYNFQNKLKTHNDIS